MDTYTPLTKQHAHDGSWFCSYYEQSREALGKGVRHRGAGGLACAGADWPVQVHPAEEAPGALLQAIQAELDAGDGRSALEAKEDVVMPKEYRTIQEVAGPLMLVKGVEGVAYDELGEIELPDGEMRRCKVLEINGGNALVQLFESSTGINLENSKVRFLGRSMELGVSRGYAGPGVRRPGPPHRRRAGNPAG